MHFDYEDFGTVLSWKRDSWLYIQLGCMPSFHCTKDSRRSERIKKEDWLEKRIGRTLDLSEKRTQSLFFMDLSESRQRTDCSFSLQGVRHRPIICPLLISVMTRLGYLNCDLGGRRIEQFSNCLDSNEIIGWSLLWIGWRSEWKGRWWWKLFRQFLQGVAKMAK